MNNFAALDIAYTHYENGLYICIKTDNPCHLTCYWTFEKPGRHKTSRIERGINLPWGAYFCFVAWKAVEQMDAGDTLYHRFNLTIWQPLNTAWFAFRGTVSGILSPSVSPIFEHRHPGGLPMNVLLLPNAPGDLCTLNTGFPHPCPNHYLNINEDPPDDDLSYVEHWEPVITFVKRDLYNIQSATLGKIAQIILHSRHKRIWGTINTSLVWLTIKTYGASRTYFTGPMFLYYVDRYRYLPTNPITNQPWTQSEIDNLQIGLTLAWHTTIPSLSKARVTQCNLTIQRGINCPDD